MAGVVVQQTNRLKPHAIRVLLQEVNNTIKNEEATHTSVRLNNQRLSGQMDIASNSNSTTPDEDVKSSAPVAQQISSAKTSIRQIPALFKNKNVEFGKTNIDIGGGKFDLND